MENINQRIVFITPGEDTTPIQITLSILENNGIKNIIDDIENNPDNPKLIIAFNAAKDFFDKKITEDKMADLFQKELNVSKDVAINIIKELKEKIIPFGKIISEPTGNKGKINVDIATSNIPVNEPIESLTTNIPTTETIITAPKRIKKVSTVITETPKQSSGPDSYREPIE